nr:MAG TPA: Chromatin remodeling complex ATPase [Caudoviricetes sp.]
MTVTIRLNKAGDRFQIISSRGVMDKERIAQLQGTRYTRTDGWTIPVAWSAYCGLVGEFGDELTADNDDTVAMVNALMQDAKTLTTLRMRTEPDYEIPPDPPVYPYQEVGAQFLAYSGRAMENDEAGSGKSLQTIRALQMMTAQGKDVFPALIVCPSNMVYNWAEEFGKWWPGIRCQTVSGSGSGRVKALRTPAHVYIINYENLHRHSRLAGYGSIHLKACQHCDPGSTLKSPSQCEVHPKELNRIPLRTIVVDEAHRIKDPKSKQTRACWAIGDTCQYRFALTATPVSKSPADLWCALRLLEPDVWTSRVRFIDRYCNVHMDFFGHMQIDGLNPQHREEFDAIMNSLSRRMLKRLILPQLPPKISSVRWVDLSTKQRRAYNELRNGMIALVGESGSDILATPDAMTRMMRLWQLASSYIEVVPVADASGKRHERVQMIAPSTKLDALMEIVEEQAGAPIVVFAESRQLITAAAERLEKAKIKYLQVVGGMTADEKHQVEVRFRSGDVPVLLCTIKAAKEGSTFTAAGTAVFLQRSWSPIDNSQAEDRVHRIGAESHDEVDIIDIVARDTMETRQRQTLAKGYASLAEVMRDEQTMRTLLGMDEPL